MRNTVLEENNIKIYESKDFGKILNLEGKDIFCQKYEFIYSEMMAHVPICTHKEPKRVLILSSSYIGVAREVLRHKEINLDLIEKDEKLIDIFKQYFPNICDFSDERLNIVIDDEKEFVSDAKEKTYDIVLVNKKSVDKTFYAHISRILKDDGLVVAVGSSWQKDFSSNKEIMKVLGESFKIVMPYRFENYLNCNYNLILGSKFYHPTADIILQRADLIDDLKYYNSDIHKASFTLPEYIKKELGSLYKW